MDSKNQSRRNSIRFVSGLVILMSFGALIVTVSASSKKQTFSASSSSAVSSTTGPATPNVDIFKAKKISYLTDAEKAYFADGHELPDLSPDDQESLARRLNNESSRTTKNKDFDTARKYHAIVYTIRKQDAEAFPEDFFKTISLGISISGFGKLEMQAENYEAARNLSVVI